MRLVVFFDLPIETAKQRKEYRLFRKGLIKEGYIMMQKSVYVKLAINDAIAESEIKRLRKMRPPEGLVQVLKVTERQYATMTYITGEYSESEELDTTDELIII